MPLAARQNATKARTVRPRSPQSSSTPAAPGAANTRMFFIHWRGRAVRTRPWSSGDVMRRPAPIGPSRSPASSWRPRRDRRRRCRGRSRPSTPKAIARRWSWWVASAAPWRSATPPGNGSMRRPSGSTTTRAPIRRSSAARSPRRSLSLARMNPTPEMVVADEAVTATAASVGTRSETSAMSTSTPRSGTVASRSTTSPPDPSVTVHPMRPRRSANTMSPWAEARRRPVTSTRPPTTAAMASG